MCIQHASNICGLSFSVFFVEFSIDDMKVDEAYICLNLFFPYSTTCKYAAHTSETNLSIFSFSHRCFLSSCERWNENKLIEERKQICLFFLELERKLKTQFIKVHVYNFME